VLSVAGEVEAVATMVARKTATIARNNLTTTMTVVDHWTCGGTPLSAAPKQCNVTGIASQSDQFHH